MTTPLKRCSNCSAYSPSSLCYDCRVNKAKAKHDHTIKKKETDPYYHSTAWKKLSTGQKTRYPYCQAIEADGTPCHSIERLEADHIVPRKQGGKDSYSNLQTLCHYHHSSKTALEASNTAFLGKPTITVVCGSPGSGKTTYVQTHRSIGDVVIDLDYIARSIAWDGNQGLPGPTLRMILAMRDAAISYLATCRGIKAAWVIEGGATLARRNYLRDTLNAKVLLLNCPINECKKRIKNAQDRDRRIDWDRLVDDWFKKYEPHSADIIIQSNESRTGSRSRAMSRKAE